MKKYYVGLYVVVIWSIILLIALLGFIWEIVDVGRFVLFAFITSVGIPLILEIILIFIFCQYITIDADGIKKYIFKIKISEFKWAEIKEIRIYSGVIYISTEQLVGELKNWNRKKFIYITYSDKAIQALKEHIVEGIIENFDK